jgi:hypothetical protein
MPLARTRRAAGLLATALLAAAVLCSAPRAAAVTVGIGDQRASTFSDPHFRALGVRSARLVIPWNEVYENPQRVDEWLAAAAAAGVRPHVAFEHARGTLCPLAPCSLVPVSEYAAAFEAFRARWPWVTTFTPWNEANHSSQPTAGRPDRAARYYEVVAARCLGCTVIAADVLDQGGVTDWVGTFRAHAEGNPRLWGLHNYSDVNRQRDTGTRAMLDAVPGTVWLTETGGVVEFHASDGREIWPYDEVRAADALRYLFGLVEDHPRITRVYVYQWRKSNGFDRFDAGLIGPGGPRPAYSVLHERLAGSGAPSGSPPEPGGDGGRAGDDATSPIAGPGAARSEGLELAMWRGPLRAGRRSRVRVSCARTRSTACTGAIALATRRVLLWRQAFSLRPGSSAVLTIRLRPTALRRLERAAPRAHSLPARLRASAGGTRVVLARRLVLAPHDSYIRPLRRSAIAVRQSRGDAGSDWSNRGSRRFRRAGRE